MAIRDVNGILHIRFQVFGKEYNQTTKLQASRPNYRIAEALEIKERERIALEVRFGQKRIAPRRFEEVAKDFRAWIDIKHRQAPRTIRSYGDSLRPITRFFEGMMMTQIGPKEVLEYMMSRAPRKAGTIRGEVWLLSRMFKHAIKMRWCDVNPVPLIREDLPSMRNSGRLEVVSPEEEKLYFAAIVHPFLYDFARLMLIHGVRPSELLELHRTKVDLDRKEFRVGTKTPASHRTLTMVPQSEEIFRRRLAGQARWVFSGVTNPMVQLHELTLNRWHRLTQQATGLTFVLYAFRHTFATRMAQGGTDLFTLKELLGHASIRMAEKYVHIAELHKREAMKRYAEGLDGGNSIP